MSWRYDIYSKYCDDDHEWETGFEDEEDAQMACDERISEICDEHDLEDDIDFDYEISQEDEMEAMYPNATPEELEEELMDRLD